MSATETTVFVYSAGKLIAEYSTATPPSNPTTSWTVTDQLGSPRVIVNSLGAVVSRRDFMPFGEELDADETYRKTLHKYGQTDSVRQKFTGYQNDTETGLDFAEARMYQNLHGRFTAVDPLLASGKSGNPQTFNRYVYVMNNPLVYTDPSGLQAGKWYEPVDENGNPRDGEFIYHYPGNSLPAGYRELTRSNRAGQLISDPTDRTHVYRFNRNGPSPFTGGLGIEWMILSDFDYKGFDVVTLDWFEDLFDEHPADGYMQGSKFVGEELFLSFSPFVRAGRFATAAAETTPALTASRSLPIINPHFTPNASAVFQNITRTANAEIASNPNLANTLLSSGELTAARAYPYVANMQYGNMVERQVANHISSSPGLHGQLFSRAGGPGRPDFVGIGNARGLRFDVTTNNPTTIQRHFARPYGGNDLIIGSYQRPPLFAW